MGTRAARIISILALLIVWSAPAGGAGAKDEKPAIVTVSLFSSGGLIVADLACAGIFSERIAGTIQSGLPAVVELMYRLVASGNRTVGRGLHAYELRYDVWEDRYSMEDNDETKEFTSFEGMAGAMEHLRAVAVIPVARLDRGKTYAAEFSIAVHPLHGTEKARIAGWVGEQVGNDAGDSWRENVLNLNDLIRHFFAREKDAANRSPWYRTEFFHPDKLPPLHEEER